MDISMKKEILQTIIRKKVVIENNYFNISKIIEEIIENANGQEEIIKLAQEKQNALDGAINFAISELEELIQKFINSLQTDDIEKHLQIEKEMQEKIDELNLKTKELTEDLSKVNIVNELSHKPSQNSQYGLFDKATEKDVNNLFGNKARNEIKDLRHGVLIENLNDPSPRELSIFDDIYFDEVGAYQEYKNNKDQVEKNVEIKKELEKMSNSSINDQLLEIEKKLMGEINKLKTSNKLIEDTNDTILSKIKKNNSNILDTNLVDTKSFDMLDVAINNMISKIEMAKIPDYKNHDISNLENISKTLIGSLQQNLESLSNDVINLKSENAEYRNKINEYIETINILKNDRVQKELELNESYAAWVSSNKKIQDLEILLGQQSIDLNDLDGQKNIIIDTLEKKLRDTIENLNSVLVQNEELINKQEELQEFIRVNNIKNDYGVGAFDNDIEAKTLQDLVETEANKIVDKKLTAMLSRYNEELQLIESRIKENIHNINQNKDILTYEFEKQSNNTNEIKEFEEKIKRFESKINRLENKIEQTQMIEAKTRESINNINEMIEFDQIKENVMESEIGKKLQSLENIINETINKVNNYDNLLSQKHIIKEHELSQNEIDNIIYESDIYANVKSEISRLEQQVNSLKIENIKIKKENFEINNELDDSFQKFTYNSNKMKHVEELLNNQMNELEKLNFEKDELILALEEKVKTQASETINNIEIEEYETPYVEYEEQTNEQKYSEYLERENIELLINKTVNELFANKAIELLNKQNEIENKYNNLNNIHNNVINNDYIDFIQQEENKKQLQNNFINEKKQVEKEDDYSNAHINSYKTTKYKYDEDDEEHLIDSIDNISENNILIPIEQSFKSSGFENHESEYNQKIEFDKSMHEEKKKEKRKDKEKMLIDELNKIQDEYNKLLDQINNQEIKNESKKISIINNLNSPIPNELVENIEKLKNFERILMQIDNEISVLENDSLNKFIDQQF